MELQQRRLALMGLLVALVATSACLAMPSIESEPVKVTHRNSGPRYEIAADNEVERTKIPEELAQRPPQEVAPPQAEGDQSGEPQPIGHLAIRRIYLFPIMPTRGSSSDWSSSEGEQPQAGGEQEQQQGGSAFAKPFWPFLTPARPSRTHAEGPHEHHHHHHEHRPHLFGADEASRSPSRPDQDRAESGEREGTAMAPREPLFDPIQMMLDMMHQAINAQMVPPQMPPQGDLNKDDRPAPSNDNSPSESSPGSDERPKMPGVGPQLKPAQNETREEIVEIEGKKYLRKTIVNRHVGENLIFMTKRLIFVPLNETETPDTTTETVATTTTTSTPAVTSSSSTPEGITEPSVIPDRVGENKPQPSTEPPATTTTMASPTTTITTTTTEEAKERVSESSPTAAPSTEQPTTTTTTTTTAEPTTPKATESFVDRVSNVIEKAAERLVEEVKSTTTTTTTQAPTVASSTSDNKPQ
ncbi:Hypothetical predicted protein [Olea europaea subsp. europaea]|uniref:Uncharacterized protein n=1 Tax=Olea europaea subsp. europaea TaxID=158383 RepID=A0A8S0RE60_OLEEU|nr:Hypothetical predicted protein [Olea europaea subsp. europaea]